MLYHVHRLTERNRAVLTRHFRELDPADRQLRFGTPISDSGIRAYVAGLEFDRSDVFAVFDDALKIVGAIHVAYENASAEMGLSVLKAWRGLGVGDRLFERATLHLSNRFIRTVTMHCLRENEAIMHIARKNGMRIVTEGAEADAWLELPAANPASVATEWMSERFALLDYGRKIRGQAARSLLRAIT
jgi:GNAT superfamily N-acetyltransferase